MNEHVVDYAIVGGGIVGLTLAQALQERLPRAKIAVFEKESALGRHASGRNSGVIHAGIYYPAETLKAKLCVEGARTMRSYCQLHGLPLLPAGKVIVPVSESDARLLDTLFQNAKANGVEVEEIDAHRLAQLEPAAAAPYGGRALYSPHTAILDPHAVLRHLAEALVKAGVRLYLGQEVSAVDPQGMRLKVGHDWVSCGFLINAAGSYADCIAAPFGFAERYSIMPFRGSYYELASDSGLTINGNIYPVPDPRVPFLGVHFTRGISGKLYVGPTAFPAFGREHYEGMKGINALEAARIMGSLCRQYGNDHQGFRGLGHQEIVRLRRSGFYEAARHLVPGLQPQHLLPCAKRGIRPQLYDKSKGMLIMDFLVESGPRSLHILNSISPAFTCSFAFARYLLDTYKFA